MNKTRLHPHTCWTAESYLIGISIPPNCTVNAVCNRQKSIDKPGSHICVWLQCFLLRCVPFRGGYPLRRSWCAHMCVSSEWLTWQTDSLEPLRYFPSRAYRTLFMKREQPHIATANLNTTFTSQAQPPTLLTCPFTSSAPSSPRHGEA